MAEHQTKPVSSPDAKTTPAEKPLKPRPVRPPLKLINATKNNQNREKTIHGSGVP
jgi:hypothetical protein